MSEAATHSSPAPAVTGVVLAGGRSSRMGRDKATLVLDGETLLQRTVRALAAVADEVVVVCAPGAALPDLDAPCPIRVVEDPVEGEGPLVGIAAGLEAARAPVVLIVGVDMPFLRPALLALLAERVAAGARWVLPIADRRPQPLCSAFARDALPVLRAHIEAGDRAPMTVAADLGMVRLAEEEWRAADPDGASFMDVDTPEDFAAAIARLDGGLRGG
ncbi:MAG: molybdenum cofactor guanylyltransferase [Dehalococcoidia bacterium]